MVPLGEWQQSRGNMWSCCARFDELEDEEEAQIDDAQVSEVAPGTAATAIDPTATPSTSGGGFFRQRGFVDITGFYQVASVQFSSTKKEEVSRNLA